ncbi:MAG: NAD-binding protein, partial [Chloroflexi bacterium]|nr:NAD-binding protein [Chloroflexota bacterium]
MSKITFRDRLRYRFDNAMAQGMGAIMGWLLLTTLLVLLIIALIGVLTGSTTAADGEGSRSLPELFWFSLMHAVDSGAIGGDATQNIFFVVLMSVSTLFGIFILSTLIGLLTNAINSKVEELRKGRSFVVEHDHTVILGWSPQVFSVISELVIANGNRPRACIVILAEQDKVMMEDEIRSRVGSTGKTRIVCRTGSPIDMADLQLVNPTAARSIIILSDESDNPDAHVIKSILALTGPARARSKPFHIVAEIHDTENLEVARLVGRDEAVFLPVSDLISRIAVQTCRQSGLSVAYTELLDFGGDEIYFHEEPLLIGKTFKETLIAYESSAVIGLRLQDGKVWLKPALDYTLRRGDKIIAVSEDDDTIVLSGLSEADLRQRTNRAAFAAPVDHSPQPERTLILGWNQRGTTMINQLDLYVAPGSEVMIVAESDQVEPTLAADCTDLKNLRVIFQPGSTTNRRILDSLNVQDYDHIITLSYMDDLPAQEADASTLVTLLHLRDIGEKMGRSFSIVSEMLDVRNRELAEVTRADDFIVSDRLISLMLSQVSENRELMDVLLDLFDPDGAELYLKPAKEYVQVGQPVNFYTVIAAACGRDEIAIGYRLQRESGSVEASYGVHLNP